jgi:hypothetical protein
MIFVVGPDIESDPSPRAVSRPRDPYLSEQAK